MNSLTLSYDCIVKDSTDWIGSMYLKSQHKDPLMYCSSLDWTLLTLKKLSAIVKMKSNDVGVETSTCNNCVQVFCVCHGAHVLHLIEAIVTSWTLSMLCQVAGYTLSNFMANKHFNQHSYWNIISRAEDVLSFPLSLINFRSFLFPFFLFSSQSPQTYKLMKMHL